MLLIRMLLIVVSVLAYPILAGAQTWTSPDGFLAVTPPAANEFQPMPTPPSPFVGLWVSNDESMKFGVMTTQIPQSIKLVQSAAEEGLAEQVGGEVVRLPTKQVSGHEVWNMTATGSSVQITQAMVRNNGTLYKVMAVTVGGDPDADAVTRFFDSLSISQASSATTEPSRQRDAQPVRDLGGGFDLHNLSKAIGGAAALLGIGLLVYLLTRGKKNRKA